MPFPKFDFNSLANPANLRNKKEEPRPERHYSDSQVLRNSCESCESVAKPEPDSQTFAAFAADSQNRKDGVCPVQDNDNAPRFADSQLSQGSDARAALTARLLEAGRALGWSDSTLEGWQSWAATAPLETPQARVDTTEAHLNPRRDTDPSGCPTHWHGVPELPPKGSRVVMVDAQGFGNLYRFKHAEAWYLLKFLPPFDGRLSLTDPQGVVRVLGSLGEVATFLAALEEPEGYPDEGERVG
ncbi:MAG: hypothetical protein KatS3mg070_1887 [Meiothermus sp.]|nr:MAG: hypothetical protein KatS3mg070_1887 [Meiothermus sp.]